jgi:hypothetical protein
MLDDNPRREPGRRSTNFNSVVAESQSAAPVAYLNSRARPVVLN